jgi:hypothetical protein
MASDGKLLEKKLSVALKQHCSQYSAWYYRFPDTRAARNLISEQPGDFMFLCGAGATLIECKSTDNGSAFKDLLDKRQIGKHRLWNRAGQPSLFMYGDDLDESVVIYHGSEVIRAWDDHGMSGLSSTWQTSYDALSAWVLQYHQTTTR